MQHIRLIKATTRISSRCDLGNRPLSLSLSIVLTLLLAACAGPSSKETVNLPPHVVGTLSAGIAPHFPAIDLDNNRLFVSNLKSASLATIDLSTGPGQRSRRGGSNRSSPSAVTRKTSSRLSGVCGSPTWEAGR